MPGSKTDYLENKVLDHTTGKAAYTMPTTSVALFTVAPTDAGGGTEVTGGAYARVTTSAATWNTASGGSISNATVITFPTATASWGTLVAFALFDAATAGNMLWWGTLTTNKAVASGDVATFAAGSIVLTED